MSNNISVTYKVVLFCLPGKYSDNLKNCDISFDQNHAISLITELKERKKIFTLGKIVFKIVFRLSGHSRETLNKFPESGFVIL